MSEQTKEIFEQWWSEAWPQMVKAAPTTTAEAGELAMRELARQQWDARFEFRRKVEWRADCIHQN